LDVLGRQLALSAASMKAIMSQASKRWQVGPQHSRRSCGAGQQRIAAAAARSGWPHQAARQQLNKQQLCCVGYD
jgi:hypothetical protein